MTPALPVFKADDEKRRVYGVALVAGTVDLQGDVISEDELEEAAIRSMRDGIAARLQHGSTDLGTVVASWPMTRSIAAALGFTLPGNGKGRWLIALEFSEAAWPSVRAAVAAGGALSIGGVAERS